MDLNTIVAVKRPKSADEVAELTEDDGAQGAHAEPRAERGEAREERRRLVPWREEQTAEEDGEAAVEVEVVPLEQRAQRRGDDHAAQDGPVDRRHRPRPRCARGF